MHNQVNTEDSRVWQESSNYNFEYISVDIGQSFVA